MKVRIEIMGLFKRGYNASREEKARQDRAKEEAGKKLWRFFLKEDGEEADVRFLTEEPVNFYEHNVKRGDRYEQYTCTGDNCPFCADGDRPTYKGAYLIVDRREFEYTDKDGKKKKGRDQVRLYVQGMKVVSQLDRISEKYGLSNRDVTIVRLGKGTNTSYTVERGEEEKLTKKEIEALLPEKIRDSYDGTMDSLMSIVEEQLLMNTKDYEPDEDDDTVSDNSDRIISVEEEDEDEAPRRIKKSGGKSMFKRPQNSTKPRARGMIE
jgi:hypothetical protein